MPFHSKWPFEYFHNYRARINNRPHSVPEIPTCAAVRSHLRLIGFGGCGPRTPGERGCDPLLPVDSSNEIADTGKEHTDASQDGRKDKDTWNDSTTVCVCVRQRGRLICKRYQLVKYMTGLLPSHNNHMVRYDWHFG